MMCAMILIAVATVVLVVVALIDCFSAEVHEIRSLPRAAWGLVILLVPVLGAIGWFVAGQPRRWTPPPPDEPGTRNLRTPARPRRRRPVRHADDDPGPLDGLPLRGGSDRELRRRWERDLRRREAHRHDAQEQFD